MLAGGGGDPMLNGESWDINDQKGCREREWASAVRRRGSSRLNSASLNPALVGLMLRGFATPAGECSKLLPSLELSDLGLVSGLSGDSGGVEISDLLLERVKSWETFDLIFLLLDTFLKFDNVGRRAGPSGDDFGFISRLCDLNEASIPRAFLIKSLMLSTLTGSNSARNLLVGTGSWSVHDTPQQLLSFSALSLPREYGPICDTIIDAIRSGPLPTKPWSSPITASGRPTEKSKFRNAWAPLGRKQRILKREICLKEAILFVRVRAKEAPLGVEAVFGRSISGFSLKLAASLRLWRLFLWVCLLPKVASSVLDPILTRLSCSQ